MIRSRENNSIKVIFPFKHLRKSRLGPINFILIWFDLQFLSSLNGVLRLKIAFIKVFMVI